MIAMFFSGLDESELAEHINKLHEYNEIKDTAQMVLGHIGNNNNNGKF